MRVLLRIFLLFLISLSNLHAEIPPKCLSINAHYFLELAQVRTEQETAFIKLYKNDPNFAGFVDNHRSNSPLNLLSDWKALKRSKQQKYHSAPKKISLTQENSTQEVTTYFFSQWFDASFGNYSRKVLSLRAGDTVSFGNREFVLGKYLGAGNASHVFELKDFPNRVIKIPFVAEEIYQKSKFFSGSEKSRMKVARRFLQNFIDFKPPKSKNLHAVKIYDHGNRYEYAIVSKVHGNLEGQNYIESLSLKYGFDPDQMANGMLKISDYRLSKDDSSKLKELLAAMRAHQKVYMGHVAYKDGTSSSDARQFLWDESIRKWILVDWE